MNHVLRLFPALIISQSFVLAQPVVPKWAEDAVWYQIFPERFRNGDTTNDPTPADLEFPPQNEFDYKGWWDIKDLPEFREDANGFIKPVREYFFNITRRWMDPNGDGDPSDGVDGWRLDVANEVSHVFWKEWRRLVKSINPDAYIVGEIWDDASTWLKGDEFDAVMNYRFARAVVRFFIDNDSRRYTATEFDTELAGIRKEYPGDVNYVLQNLIDSRDTDRLGSMIMNPNRKYDDQNGLRNNPNYNVREPTPPARRIQKLIALFQMTYLGAPMFYYGDEAGMWGAGDPDDRKPMVWPDLTYENEKTHPIPGKTRTDDVVRFDRDLFNYCKKLVRIRKECVALRQEDFRTLLTDDAKGVYVFLRKLGDGEAIVALNKSGEEQHVDIKQEGPWKYREQLSGKELVGRGTFESVLQPKSGSILVKIR